MTRRAGANSAGAILGALALGAVLGSCGKHGAYTQAHKDNAEERLAQIKAATDWDMANQQYEGGDLERALRTVDASIAASDKVAKSHLLRGKILVELGRTEEALPSLDKAAELDPALPDPHYYRGVALERVGKREGALKAYRKASELKPAEAQYTLASAEMLMELGRLDAARHLLEVESKGLDYNPGARQTLGHIAMMQGRTQDAVENFSEAAVLGGDDPALLEDLARAQIAAGRFSDAETSLSRLTSVPGAAPRRDLMHLRARCLLELGRPVDARDILVTLTSDPRHANDVEAWVRLADVALVLGDDHQLRSVANRLIAIAPDRSEGYMALAMWQKRAGDIPAALRSATKAQDRAVKDHTVRKFRASLERDLRQDAIKPEGQAPAGGDVADESAQRAR